MVEVNNRESWGARSPKAVNRGTLADVSTGHWNGPTVKVSGNSKWNHSACASLLRGIQNFHMDSRGWLDIAYNFAVCPHRAIFELRGLNVKNGANGTNHGNVSSHAILFIAGEGNDFTDDEKRAFINCVNYIAANTQAPARAIGHRDHKATACPGDARYDWIKKGMPIVGDAKPAPKPTPAPAPAPAKDDAAAVLNFIDAVVKAIIAGKHGSGEDRIRRLMAAGFNREQVQALQDEVNRRLRSPRPPVAAASKDNTAAALIAVDRIVKDIIAGKYGNGPTRTTKLRSIGLNDAQIKAIQAEVNKRLR